MEGGGGKMKKGGREKVKEGGERRKREREEGGGKEGDEEGKEVEMGNTMLQLSIPPIPILAVLLLGSSPSRF